ncbi:MAG TPA: hypothetical protein VGD83_04990 [Streptosporangiaceae bacterium]
MIDELITRMAAMLGPLVADGDQRRCCHRLRRPGARVGPGGVRP